MPEKRYSVKEIFGPTFQGEAGMQGVLCNFLRFAGCNMWDGRPETRAASKCPYCDTDFFKGEKLTAAEIVARLKACGPARWVWISGGEPLLQLDQALCDQLVLAGYQLGLETNGTQSIKEVAGLISWVVLSPKVPASELVLTKCEDLKVLYPHPDPRMEPEQFFNNVHHIKGWLQPIDVLNMRLNFTWSRGLVENTATQANLAATQEYIKSHPHWRLSVQTHKYLGVR